MERIKKVINQIHNGVSHRDKGKKLAGNVTDITRNKFKIAALYLGEPESKLIGAIIELFIRDYEEECGEIRLPERFRK